ncbi:MAG: hypothetical protein EOM83_01915 [Clostridia bacterium]|nr:hypothetical protein [Clostridia bacterium]
MNLLIIAAVVLVLVIIFIRMYPLLHITTTRLFFGKYSARYVATYKRYTLQSPYSYCIKDDFINHLAGCYKIEPTLPVYDSALEIEFSDVPFGKKFKEVIRAFPSPICINANRFPAFELQALGYKNQVFGHEMKKYLFFANGIFFMGQITFNHSTAESREELVILLQKKYLNGTKSTITDFLIRGKNQSFLRCEYNGFYLILSYLSRANANTIGLVDEHWESNVATSQIVQQPTLQAELMDKL